MDTRAIVIASLFLWASCVAPASRNLPPRPAAEPQAAPAGGSTNPVESVPLQIHLTDQTTTGRVMKLRGKIVNPYREPVEGVRLQLAFIVPSGEGGTKILEVQQKEMGATLQPGGSAMLRWDVESLYLGSSSGFVIFAYPKHLGDQNMPPPDHWRE